MFERRKSIARRVFEEIFCEIEFVECIEGTKDETATTQIQRRFSDAHNKGTVNVLQFSDNSLLVVKFANYDTFKLVMKVRNVPKSEVYNPEFNNYVEIMNGNLPW